jgi:ribulose-phosphate 3-epimerase
MPEMMDKVKELRKKFNGYISVDGGIAPDTASQALRAGANVLVAGTAIFGEKDRVKAISQLRSAL